MLSLTATTLDWLDVGLATFSGKTVLAVLALLGNESPKTGMGTVRSVFFVILILLLGIVLLLIQYVLVSEEKLLAEHRLAEFQRVAGLERLAGGVAHFFNNQMQVIQLACYLLRQLPDASNSAGARYIAQIENASLYTSNIIGRLRQFAQCTVLRPSRFDPGYLVSRMMPELRLAAGERIELSLSTVEQVLGVELDADALRSAILALVQNARDAMPQGGKLTISLRHERLDLVRARQLRLPPSTFVVIVLADTGPGMDNETMCHLFEPFFTTGESPNVEGLGLASVHGFIQQSGGAITVRSRIKEGSMFELYLPTVALSPIEKRRAS
jgi:two-component system, cell cycle sensor histidine kinase and response regulator CckA